ncbi:MAG TPA: site-specific integrase [Thermoplasmata archaeon]|nr:site-specific integrase [Thermoplasmata archaeon]
MAKSAHRKALLEDPDIDRWYRNVARGSLITADVYLRRLGAFCDQTKTPPVALLALPDRKLRDLVLDFVSNEEKAGRAGSYVKSSVKAVKSWLGFGERKLSTSIRIKGANATPTLSEERTPTQEELRRIFLSATPRDRVSCVLMAHAGLRPEVLGNYLGNDGLRLKDFPELKLQATKVEFEKLPSMIVVRPELSKTGHRYLTWIGSEAAEYLAGYLEERMRSGEKLGPESDIVSPGRAKKTFVRTMNVGDGLRTAIRAAGFRWRPYVLRSYFDTQLLLAESKGKLARDYRVFWMGHSGSMDARYTTNKGRLSKDLIEDMRAAYERCQPFLSTLPAVTDSQEGANRVLRAMLTVRGYPKEEAEKLDVSGMTDPELEALFKKLVVAASPVNGRRRIERAFPVADVSPRLDEGWEYVAPLGADRAVLRAPEELRKDASISPPGALAGPRRD